jgi:type I restriction enzyme S subunit
MVIRSKGRVSPEFIYFYLTHKTTVDYLQMIAESRSGTFPQITFEQIKPLKIKVPAEKILKEAELWCKSVLDKILFNKKQIQQLETLRDTLLPKLMSGAVNIEK